MIFNQLWSDKAMETAFTCYYPRKVNSYFGWISLQTIMPSPEISIDLASQDKQKHAPEIQLILFYFNDLQQYEDGIQDH